MLGVSQKCPILDVIWPYSGQIWSKSFETGVKMMVKVRPTTFQIGLWWKNGFWPNYRHFTVFSVWVPFWPFIGTCGGSDRKTVNDNNAVKNLISPQTKIESCPAYFSRHFDAGFEWFWPFLTKLSPIYIQNCDFLGYPPNLFFWNVRGSIWALSSPNVKIFCWKDARRSQFSNFEALVKFWWVGRKISGKYQKLLR